MCRDAGRGRFSFDSAGNPQDCRRVPRPWSMKIAVDCATSCSWLAWRPLSGLFCPLRGARRSYRRRRAQAGGGTRATPEFMAGQAGLLQVSGVPCHSLARNRQGRRGRPARTGPAGHPFSDRVFQGTPRSPTGGPGVNGAMDSTARRRPGSFVQRTLSRGRIGTAGDSGGTAGRGEGAFFRGRPCRRAVSGAQVERLYPEGSIAS